LRFCQPSRRLFNPGRLFGDLTVDKLKRDDYQSRARNKLIAEAFYLTRDIEKYGSGFIRIRKEILAYPTMTMSYSESGDGFLVTLAYQQQKIASAPVSPEGVNEGVNEGVTKLLEYISKAPGKRIPQHSRDLGVPRKTIERWIALLKRENLIEYRGSSRTGGYFANGNQKTIQQPVGR
jgi:ATP-dependent DNA helicase RecG